jgi:hypothetical protein
MDFATIATIAISVVLTFKTINTKFLEKGAETLGEKAVGEFVNERKAIWGKG